MSDYDYFKQQEKILFGILGCKPYEEVWNHFYFMLGNWTPGEYITCKLYRKYGSDSKVRIFYLYLDSLVIKIDDIFAIEELKKSYNGEWVYHDGVWVYRIGLGDPNLADIARDFLGVLMGKKEYDLRQATELERQKMLKQIIGCDLFEDAGDFKPVGLNNHDHMEPGYIFQNSHGARVGLYVSDSTIVMSTGHSCFNLRYLVDNIGGSLPSGYKWVCEIPLGDPDLADKVRNAVRIFSFEELKDG